MRHAAKRKAGANSRFIDFEIAQSKAITKVQMDDWRIAYAWQFDAFATAHDVNHCQSLKKQCFCYFITRYFRRRWYHIHGVHSSNKPISHKHLFHHKQAVFNTTSHLVYPFPNTMATYKQKKGRATLAKIARRGGSSSLLAVHRNDQSAKRLGLIFRRQVLRRQVQ